MKSLFMDRWCDNLLKSIVFYWTVRKTGFFLCRQPKPGDKHATLVGKFSKYVEDSFELLTKAIFIILVGTAWFSKAQSYLQRISIICHLNVICANIGIMYSFYKISTCSFKYN